MHCLPFLKTLFPLHGDETDAAELIRFVVVSRQNPWPGTLHWKTRAELHTISDESVSALGFDIAGKDVYVTPHAFVRRDLRVTKDDAAPLGDVCWVELDDPDIRPESFVPAPTLTVATSPGRFHLYWLLRKPLAIKDIEQINWRLVYGNGVKIDKSGWGITKWLRLPGSVSYKRETPFPIEVVEYTGEVFSASDFDNLPAAPDLIVGAGRPAPDDPTPMDVAGVKSKYPLPSELVDILSRVRPDRSAALWRAYHLCHRIGLSEEECYALIRGCANDKFTTEWRYNGADGLWRDICRGYYMAHTPEDQGVFGKVNEIRTARMPADEKHRRIADVVKTDLAQVGGFYFDNDLMEAFYVTGNRVVPIEDTHNRWKIILGNRYGMIEASKEFAAVNDHLYNLIAVDTSGYVTPRSFTWWDIQRRLLYIYNGNGHVYRLDGDTIDIVSNGTDGVLFRQDDEVTPFEALEPPSDSFVPTLQSAIFSLPNYEDDMARHTRTEAELLLRIWTYAIFFGEQMEARPILAIVGGTDSGKTSAFKAIGELLKGEKFDVTGLPTDRLGFETTVSNSRFVFFDNIDDASGRRWLIDALAETATGIRISRRKLYTTNTELRFRIQCFLGLTTRNPWFARTDIATRLVPLHVERRDMKLDPAALFGAIREHRGHLWWELLDDLNKIIVALRDTKPQERRLRMAGFVDFMEAACHALGVQSERLIHVLQGSQTSSALENSIVWQVLQVWIRAEDRDTGKLANSGQRTTAAKLHTALKNVAHIQGCEHEYERKVPTAKSLAHQLKELLPDVQQVVDASIEKANPSAYYTFTIREETTTA